MSKDDSEKTTVTSKDCIFKNILSNWTDYWESERMKRLKEAKTPTAFAIADGCSPASPFPPPKSSICISTTNLSLDIVCCLLYTSRPPDTYKGLFKQISETKNQWNNNHHSLLHLSEISRFLSSACILFCQN